MDGNRQDAEMDVEEGFAGCWRRHWGVDQDSTGRDSWQVAAVDYETRLAGPRLDVRCRLGWGWVAYSMEVNWFAESCCSGLTSPTPYAWLLTDPSGFVFTNADSSKHCAIWYTTTTPTLPTLAPNSFCGAKESRS